MPTRAWNEADPANADNASLGAQEIRELKVDVRERMALEHLFGLLVGSTEAGMHIWDYKTKTISYALAVTDHFIFATQGTTMTLPAIAAANKGKAFAIKVNGTGTVTIARTGADTIDGATSLSITGTALGGEVAYLISDGVSDWKRYITYKPDETAFALSSYKGLVIKSVADHVSVDIDADEVVLVNSSGQAKKVSSVNLTVDLDVSAAINGRDAGAVAANQGWFLYVISNGTTTAGLASESATAPTLPAGYTYKALVGWCTTDETATPFNIEEFTQIDEEYVWTVPQKAVAESGSTSVETFNMAVGGNLTYALVPPGITKAAIGKGYVLSGRGLFMHPVTFSSAPAEDNSVTYIELGMQYGLAVGLPYRIPLVESQTFYWQQHIGGTVSIYVTGFELKR